MGYGEPNWARSWKRRIQPRGYLKDASWLPLLGSVATRIGECHSGFRKRRRFDGAENTSPFDPLCHLTVSARCRSSQSAET